jgi:hypothetical protein
MHRPGPVCRGITHPRWASLGSARLVAGIWPRIDSLKDEEPRPRGFPAAAAPLRQTRPRPDQIKVGRGRGLEVGQVEKSFARLFPPTPLESKKVVRPILANAAWDRTLAPGGRCAYDAPR